MTYDEEQKLLLNNFLEKQIYCYWRDSDKDCQECSSKSDGYQHSLELIISSACNTQCTYCYYKNFKEDLNPTSICGKDNILRNLEALLIGLSSKELKPSNIEIFSGEFFRLPYYKDILNLLKKYIKHKCAISIPTNCTFALKDSWTEEIESILAEFNNSNLQLWLSLSCDGYYLDNTTRPLRNKKLYSDDYYDRLFKFAAKHKYSFHPMISAHGIRYWKDNFKWFMDNIQKYYNVDKKEAYRYLYLLEVRNPDWTPENLKDLDNFIDYLLGDLKNTFKDSTAIELFGIDLKKSSSKGCSTKRPLLNLFGSLASTTGRGIGCSLQTSYAIRLGDLRIVPCHRTAYEGFSAGYYKREDLEKGILKAEPENFLVFMATQSFSYKNLSSCNSCIISNLCTGPCIGCNYEVNKDFFTPVNPVCALEKSKIISMIKAFDKYDMFDFLIQRNLKNRFYDKYYQLKAIREALKSADAVES